MGTEGLRDYLYISVRKTERMASTLPSRILRRLKGVNFEAAGFGAGLELSDAQRQGVVAMVGKVEDAIRKQHQVRPAFNEDVRVGHWVSASGMAMAYGIPEGYGRAAGQAAVFAGSDGNSHLVLSGSAKYLLDRDVAPTDVGGSMSDPSAIGRLLRAAGRERDGVDEDVTRSPWLDIGYPIHNLTHMLSLNGLYPLTFLARVTHVSLNDETAMPEQERYIVGTPLYVALDVPE
jgi:hypothetical protein